MIGSEHRFSWNGDTIRVVIAGDVIALPDERWSMGGFGDSISVEWLLHEAKIPGPAPRRRALAACIVRALEARAGDPALEVERRAAAERIHGPQVRCPTCSGRAFVLRSSIPPAGA